MAYSLGIAHLQEELQVIPTHWVRWDSPPSMQKPKFEIMSLCVYSPDPTSNTVLDSPLPGMSPINHEMYAKHWGMDYNLLTSLLLPDREAHYSKMLSVHQRLLQDPSIDWVFFIDCDAFFTDLSTSPFDLLTTYTDEQTKFIVAEDGGGINTGVFLAKNDPWTADFLGRVTMNPYTIAWDQSMFFMEIVNGTRPDSGVFGNPENDSSLPPEVIFLHQKHFNAFVQPAAKDWQAYEWQPGDYIKHFAGCPWQEKPCLDKMYETVAYFEDQFIEAHGEAALVNGRIRNPHADL